MMKIVSIIKSVVFNFTLFPFCVAMKMPILVGESTEWRYLKKGGIELPENISIGMIKLGCDKGSYGVECNKHSYISIGENSKIIFKGRARFAQGVSLRCDNGGTIEIGDAVSFNQNCFIASNTKVSLGNDVMGGWNVVIRDCDGHSIYNLNSDQPLIGEKPIAIGNHVWLGSEATIMKGAKIPDDSVVGWGSLVTHDLTTYQSVVIAGRPAKVIREGIRWEH